MEWIIALYVASSVVLSWAVLVGHAQQDLGARALGYDLLVAWTWPAFLAYRKPWRRP